MLYEPFTSPSELVWDLWLFGGITAAPALHTLPNAVAWQGWELTPQRDYRVSTSIWHLSELGRKKAVLIRSANKGALPLRVVATGNISLCVKL